MCLEHNSCAAQPCLEASHDGKHTAIPASYLPMSTAGAQLGIIFDTDVDRSAVVDGDGTPINSNRFIALMAAIVLQVGEMHGPVSCRQRLLVVSRLR